MERKEFLEKVLAYGRQAGFADCEVYYRGGKVVRSAIMKTAGRRVWRFAETSTGGQAMPIPNS